MRSPLRRALSVRTYVVGLIVVVLLPLIAFSGFLVIRSAEHEQDIMASFVRDRTRATASAIESELSAWRARLFIVASEVNREPTSLVTFRERAAEDFPGMTVILTDLSGQEVVNTEVAFGTALPMSADTETLRRVSATRSPDVADMTIDPVTQRPAATISVPVMVNGALTYVLSLDVLPTLSDLLTQLDLPPGWIATIADRTGITIGRNHDADRYVGQAGRPLFIKQIHTAEDGWFPGVSREGVPLYNAFDHIRLGQWTILIGIPRDILFAPVHQSSGGLILLGSITLVVAIALASLIGQRIATPVVRLVPLAEAVGRGDPVTHDPTRLSEANAVANSLFEASQRLRQTGHERETALSALQQSEQQYRRVAEDLVRVNQERTGLLLRTLAAQEDERARIARELHDGLAQYLTAMRLQIDLVEQIVPPCSDRIRSLEGLKTLTGDLGRAVNRMAWELRPVPLEELGLPAAVSHYLEEWAERSDVNVDVEVQLGDRKLSSEVEATLFRVLQEATTNVVRHAAADHVGVILTATADEVHLIVEDNGKGLAIRECGLSADRAVRSTKRLGVVGMRERLALVHGSLDIESIAGRGTTLFVRIPL
jgi:signal transduction histidine kinase